MSKRIAERIDFTFTPAPRVRGAALPMTAGQKARAQWQRDWWMLAQAGIDPKSLMPAKRRAEIARLKAEAQRERRAKQAGVKRLHEARRRQAMPPWVDREEVAAIYAEARRLTLETGIPHEVDHIEPLLGRNASGLHVPYNLRVVTRTENRRKGNRRMK